MNSSASDYLTLRCRSVPLRQSLWCRSVPISAATISRFRHLTAPNGTQRHLTAPKTFFSRFPAGQIGKQTVKFSNSSTLKARPRTLPILLEQKVRTDPGASSQIKPNQASGEYSSECCAKRNFPGSQLLSRFLSAVQKQTFQLLSRLRKKLHLVAPSFAQLQFSPSAPSEIRRLRRHQDLLSSISNQK